MCVCVCVRRGAISSRDVKHESQPRRANCRSLCRWLRRARHSSRDSALVPVIRRGKKRSADPRARNISRNDSRKCPRRRCARDSSRHAALVDRDDSIRRRRQTRVGAIVTAFVFGLRPDCRAPVYAGTRRLRRGTNSDVADRSLAHYSNDFRLSPPSSPSGLTLCDFSRQGRYLVALRFAVAQLYRYVVAASCTGRTIC